MRLRVSKYDPSQRNSAGHFTGQDFTSVWDVGKFVDGKQITTSDYLQVEDAYLLCVQRLLSTSNIDRLQIVDLEWHPATVPVNSTVELVRPVLVEHVSESMILEGESIDTIVRMALRERLWCRLTGANGVYIHFGYDLYLYLGSNIERSLLGDPPTGIFYEDFDSPYL